MTADGFEARVAVLEAQHKHLSEAITLAHEERAMIIERLDSLLAAFTELRSQFDRRGDRLAAVEKVVEDHKDAIRDYREIRAQGRGIAWIIGISGVGLGGIVSWLATAKGYLPMVGK